MVSVLLRVYEPEAGNDDAAEQTGSPGEMLERPFLTAPWHTGDGRQLFYSRSELESASSDAAAPVGVEGWEEFTGRAVPGALPE